MMENISFTNNVDLMPDKINETNYDRAKLSNGRIRLNPVFVSLIAEGGENFFHYVKGLGLAKEPNLMVLSSNHHYYYDSSDLMSIKVLVNLKKMNLIKNLDGFLHAVFRILPPKAIFIGYFSDNKMQKGIGLPLYQSSGIFNRFINFLDSRTDRNMDKNDVSKLFESHGFKVVDMTEINGQIYFRTQNKRA